MTSHPSFPRNAAPPAAVIALSSLMLASSALAQDAATVTARRDLVDQAQQARAAADHRRALDLANRAAQLHQTPSLRLFIAEEQNALRLYAEASGNAEVCVREADRDHAMRNRDAILAACRDLAASIRPHLGRVTVQLSSGLPEGVRVVVGGVELNHALFGVPYTVNPGTVVIDASAPGWIAFRREVPVAEGASIDVSLAMTRDPSIAVVSRHPVQTGAHARPGAAPWVVAGVGGALLVASSIPALQVFSGAVSGDGFGRNLSSSH